MYFSMLIVSPCLNEGKWIDEWMFSFFFSKYRKTNCSKYKESTAGYSATFTWNAALTRSSLICWENNRANNKTMDPSPENNRAAWYQGPMKLEVVKSCVVSDTPWWTTKFFSNDTNIDIWISYRDNTIQ